LEWEDACSASRTRWSPHRRRQRTTRGVLLYLHSGFAEVDVQVDQTGQYVQRAGVNPCSAGPNPVPMEATLPSLMPKSARTWPLEETRVSPLTSKSSASLWGDTKPSTEASEVRILTQFTYPPLVSADSTNASARSGTYVTTKGEQQHQRARQGGLRHSASPTCRSNRWPRRGSPPSGGVRSRGS